MNRSFLLFSAYRKDDFANADAFITQLGQVLERYTDQVVIAVTEPTTGLQRSCKFPPSIAEVVEACDYHTERNARIAELSQTQFERREPRLPENVANLFVCASHPDYPRYVEWSKTADARGWKWDEQGRAGIWVGYDAMSQIAIQKYTVKPWKRFTAEELVAKYPKHGDSSAAVHEPDEPVRAPPRAAGLDV